MAAYTLPQKWRPPLTAATFDQKVYAATHGRHFGPKCRPSLTAATLRPSKVAAVSTGRFCREMVRTAIFFSSHMSLSANCLALGHTTRPHIHRARTKTINPHLQNSNTAHTRGEHAPPARSARAGGRGEGHRAPTPIWAHITDTGYTRVTVHTVAQAEVGRDREQEEGRQKSHRRLRLGRRPP